jgi:hypothetical protein
LTPTHAKEKLMEVWALEISGRILGVVDILEQR